MEAAPRPSTESLPDLPVEEPVDGVSTAAKPAAATPTAPAAGAAGAGPATVDNAGTQTLELMDPELLLAPGDAPAPAPAAPAVEASQTLEIDPSATLTLEDTATLEKLFSAPPPAASAPPSQAPAVAPRSSDDSMLTLIPDSLAALAAKTPEATPAPSAPPIAKRASATPADAPPSDTPAFVPLARRASLSAAAKKLAAASPGVPAPQPKPAVPARPATPAASVTTLKPAPLAPRPPAAAPTPNATSPAPNAPPAAEAPSLASWANARAAAAASTKNANAAPARTAAAPAPRPVQPPATDKSRPVVPAVASAAPAAAAAALPPSRGMDRDFIARNQVVERYLSGKLPIKAATDFERYCKEHPELLDELGLPERVNAGLRLLEASGKPEPWQDESRPVWQQPMVTLGLAGLTAVLVLTLAIVGAGSVGKSRKILDLQTQVSERTLDPAGSTRVIRLMPNRSGATNTPAITIGGGHEALLADLRIDESRSPYRDFRVTIDRIDQGRVMVIDNLTKDSNGHLRIALNNSALGPGSYLFTIEGLTTRLEPQPDSWVTVGVAQR